MFVSGVGESDYFPNGIQKKVKIFSFEYFIAYSDLSIIFDGFFKRRFLMSQGVT